MSTKPNTGTPATPEQEEDMYKVVDEQVDEQVPGPPPVDGQVPPEVVEGVNPPPAAAPEAGTEETTSEGSGDAGSEGEQGEAPAGQQPGGETAQAPAGQAPQQQSLTPEQIRQIAQETAAEFDRARQAAQPPPQMTPEEIKKLLNPIELTKEEIAEAFGIVDPTPAQMKAMEKVLLKATRHSVALGNLAVEQRMREMHSKFAPIEQQFEAQQRVEARGALLSKHPHLDKYDELVKVAAHQISPILPSGQQKTRDQIFDEVNYFVVSTLAKSGVSITASPSANPVPAKGAVPQMVQRSQPGRSVASQSAGKPNNADDDIYS